MDSELQQSIPFFVKQHIAVILIGSLLGLFIHMVASGETSLSESMSTFQQGVLSSSLGVFVSLIVNLLSKWMNRNVSWKTKPGLRFLSGLLLNLTVVGLIIKGLDLILSGSQPFYITKLYLLSLIALVIYSVFYFALYSYHAHAQEQLKEVRVVREQIDLQYAALRSQLSPHFLFNGLNTISALVHEDKAKAKSFIRNLANCYDFVLDNYQNPLIKVKDELRFVESYVFLLKTRFENNIELNINLTAKVLNTEVPPLAIQMLIENASKHNIISDKQKLSINISSTNGTIRVQNNKTASPNKVSSFKIGLKNIFNRYKLLGYDSVTVDNDQNFTVSLPIIIPE